MDRVHIVPIGEPDFDAITAIADEIRGAFGTDVACVRAWLDARPAYDPGRNQYSSRQMIRMLRDHVPEPQRVLGVTTLDLFMPVLTFVFGEAELGGRAAVVSIHRLSQAYYGLPESIPLIHERAVKEALHELGHTWGLIHCVDYRCVMRASRAVEDIDLKGHEFCWSCTAAVETSE